jgi:hypothetical protein
MALAHGNLADPEYEPTDEELRDLVQCAFADVAARNQAALQKVHAEIATLRASLMQQLVATPRPEPMP